LTISSHLLDVLKFNISGKTTTILTYRGMNIGKYLKFYNEKRLHQALDYNTPAEVYFSGLVDREAINY